MEGVAFAELWQAKGKLLVVEDDEDTARMLQYIFESEGFAVTVGSTGLEAVGLASVMQPDCIVLDLGLPDRFGVDVARDIRAMPSLSRVPIIFLTARDAASDREAGLEVGDDYIVKPFEHTELRLRVRNALRRAREAGAFNPLTGLPGNNLITVELQRRLDGVAPWALLYVDLDNFKAFNDRYGFPAGDGAIKRTAELLERVADDVSPRPFVGHVGGDDFVMAADLPKAEALCATIVQRFAAAVAELHPDEDRVRGYYLAKSRRGQVRHVPLLAVSIGVVPVDRPFPHVAALGSAAAEVKRLAKAQEHSSYFIDRRRS